MQIPNRRPPGRKFGQPWTPDPPPAEIKERCLEIQAGWSAYDEYQHRVQKSGHLPDPRTYKPRKNGKELVVPVENEHC